MQERIPPAFVPRQLRTPAMAETRPGSVFTPAIAAWSSPGQLGALGLPSWANIAAVALFLGLAAMRKIPWWAGLLGAGVAWWYLTPAAVASLSLTSGVGVVANGTTLQFSNASPATLTGSGTAATLTVGGTTYPVLQTQANPDGTTTYYLDNPLPVAGA
jgi:hypothetical protein